jgi:protein TonB
MIGDAASGRNRRVVAGGVVLGHALLLWLALMVHSNHADEPVRDQFVTMRLDFQQRPMGALPAPTKNPDLQLQVLAPRTQDVPVQQFETELPEPEVQPLVAEAAPPASAPVTDQADSGLAGDASDVGGQSAAGDGLVLLQRVLPVYPASSVRSGEQGVTGVLLHIAPNGRVDDVKVERSSGSRQLDKAAVEAFRKWKFQRLPPGSAPNGSWLRTVQRFILYRFTYSRLDARAAEDVYAEHLKPKPGANEEATPGGEEALTRFIAQVHDQTVDLSAGAPRGESEQMRVALAVWGALKSVSFTGIAGSSRWVRQRTRPDSSGAVAEVEVSWNMYEVRHENATSEWLVAMDHGGEIWAARAVQASWK